MAELLEPLQPSQKIAYLRAIEIFRDLSPEDMQWLERATSVLDEKALEALIQG